MRFTGRWRVWLPGTWHPVEFSLEQLLDASFRNVYLHLPSVIEIEMMIYLKRTSFVLAVPFA